MNIDKDSEDFIKAAKSLLDNSVDDLDNDTVTQLKAIRKQSLAHIRSAPNRFGRAPMLALAATVVVFTVAISIVLTNPVNQNGILGSEDLSLLSANDDLELYDELEFYRWLADEEQYT